MPRFMPVGWTIPAIDHLNETYITSGRLMLQRCSGCKTVLHPPEDWCHHCGGTQFEHVEAKGTGTIYSYAVAHYPAAPALQSVVPYTIVLVQLDDQPHVRIVGNVVNADPSTLAIGQRVRVTFEEIRDEEAGVTIQLPQWEVVR